MAKEREKMATFDYFMENLNRLQTDQRFREVLRELDEGKKETLSLLASDPVAFLRYRGVQIPQDFRISVKKTFKDAATHEPLTRAEIEEIRGPGGGGYIIICDCIEVCFLRYCSIFCYCTIFENQQAASS